MPINHANGKGYVANETFLPRFVSCMQRQHFCRTTAPLAFFDEDGATPLEMLLLIWCPLLLSRNHILLFRGRSCHQVIVSLSWQILLFVPYSDFPFHSRI